MKFVSIPELAEILDLSPATVRTRIKDGQWPFYELGERSIRLDVDEIKSLLRSPGKTSKASKQKPSLSGILASQRAEVLALRGCEIEKGPRRKG